MVCVTQKDLDECIKAFAANNTEGVIELAAEGRAVLAGAGTKVGVLDKSWASCQIRLLSGNSATNISD